MSYLLQFPPDETHVSVARKFAALAARELGASDDQCTDVELAVSEATTNAMRAHRRTKSPEALTMVVSKTDAQVCEISVYDRAAGLSDGQDGGSGVLADSGRAASVMSAVTDECDMIQRSGTRVRLRFKVT